MRERIIVLECVRGGNIISMLASTPDRAHSPPSRLKTFLEPNAKNLIYHLLTSLSMRKYHFKHIFRRYNSEITKKLLLSWYHFLFWRLFYCSALLNRYPANGGKRTIAVTTSDVGRSALRSPVTHSGEMHLTKSTR